MMLGVQGLQSQKASSGGGTFAIPDDGGVVVVSRSDGELCHAMFSSNHIMMHHGYHELEITVHDCSLGVVS